MKRKKGTLRLLISSSLSHVQLLCRSCCLSKNSKLGQEISVGMVLLWNSKLFYWPKRTISRFVSGQFFSMKVLCFFWSTPFVLCIAWVYKFCVLTLLDQRKRMVLLGEFWQWNGWLMAIIKLIVIPAMLCRGHRVSPRHKVWPELSSDNTWHWLSRYACGLYMSVYVSQSS